MATDRICHSGQTWFDRSVCPEPCGSMHDRCVDCGSVVGQPCANEVLRQVEPQDLQQVRQKLLEEQHAHLDTQKRLEALESRHEALQRDEGKQREDLEDLQNQIEDLKAEKARLERTPPEGIEEAVRRSRGRLVNAFMALGMMPTDALVTVVNLLGSLPGARDFGPVSTEEDLFGRTPEEQEADFAKVSERFSEVRRG